VGGRVLYLILIGKIFINKSRWVVNWLYRLFFMNERLLHVLSSSTCLNTFKPSQISTNFMYSLSFSFEMVIYFYFLQFGDWIQIIMFIHYPLHIVWHSELEKWGLHVNHMWILKKKGPFHSLIIINPKGWFDNIQEEWTFYYKNL